MGKSEKKKKLGKSAFLSIPHKAWGGGGHLVIYDSENKIFCFTNFNINNDCEKFARLL